MATETKSSATGIALLALIGLGGIGAWLYWNRGYARGDVVGVWYNYSWEYMTITCTDVPYLGVPTYTFLEGWYPNVVGDELHYLFIAQDALKGYDHKLMDKVVLPDYIGCPTA